MAGEASSGVVGLGAARDALRRSDARSTLGFTLSLLAARALHERYCDDRGNDEDEHPERDTAEY